MTKIVEANIVEQSNEDLTAYAIYTARKRSLPSYIDGLKVVHRRILYTLFEHFPMTKRGITIKSAACVGKTMSIHPHGDAGIYNSFNGLINWFECYRPILIGQGSFGNPYSNLSAAPRYTEVCISPYALDCIISDLSESPNSIDWEKTFDFTSLEPIYFPAKVPNLLINGSFGIAVGLRTQIPSHNINEVIDATINLIDNPNADVVLVPDDCQGSDIVEADFVEISHTGRGKYRTRAKINITEVHGKPALEITSLPNMVFFETVAEKIEKMKKDNVLPQIIDILHESSIDFSKKAKDRKEIFKVMVILKKGSDPNYVRDVLYSTTELEKTTSVNFEVVYHDTPVVWSYKQYLLEFINMRRKTKMRMFSYKLKETKTKMHELWLYIYVLESGKVNQVINLIRKQKSVNEEDYINALIKLLPKVTPLQAKFLLRISVSKLSEGYLAQYKKEYGELEQLANEYYHKAIHAEDIDNIIKSELIEVKKKYGCPRRSNVIKISEANNIPEGVFKVIITEKGFIKKLDQNDKFLGLRDDKALFVIDIDNTDALLLFGKLGKVYKIPVYKIPFSGKGSNGVDIRTVVKKYVGEGICTLLPESSISILEKMFKEDNSECNVFIVTEQGLFKRIKLNELYNIPLSGLMYTKLNENDKVVGILAMDPLNEMILYANNKILRLPGMSAPLLNRSTKGNIGMATHKYLVDGISCIYPNATDVVAITESGRINKVPLSIVRVGKRGQVGDNVIKLNKTDKIYSIYVCNYNDIITVTTHRGEKSFIVKDLPNGSSISTGEKLIDSSGITSINIKRQ
jgi:DNA gyrase subunit A